MFARFYEFKLSLIAALDYEDAKCYAKNKADALKALLIGADLLPERVRFRFEDMRISVSASKLPGYLKVTSGVDWRKVSDRIAIHRKLDERNSTMDQAALDGLRKQIKAMGREPALPSGNKEARNAIGTILLQQRILGEALLAILTRLDEVEVGARCRASAGVCD